MVILLLLALQVADNEIQDRLSQWQRPPLRFTSGYLALYAQLAESADQGAILRHRSPIVPSRE